jgi:hypothetical protein
MSSVIHLQRYRAARWQELCRLVPAARVREQHLPNAGGGQAAGGEERQRLLQGVFEFEF